jgi:transposase
MEALAEARPAIVAGVDTHKELHVAAAVDSNRRLLGVEQFSTTRAGYRALVRWLRGLGEVQRVGIESTGSYGAGITRHLRRVGIEVVEVARPERSDRPSRGKSDPFDAEAVARASLVLKRVTAPKAGNGKVEALRVLRVTRTTAVKSRRAALQLLRNQIVAAPDDVRESLRNLTRMQLIRTCAAFRPDLSIIGDPVVAVRLSLRSRARRMVMLDDEIAALNEQIERLVKEINPALISCLGVGMEVARQPLVTAGDNPDRMRSEAGFAMLCGVAPLPASSGQTKRHRLNRGGDRNANSALHLTVITRMRTDPRTRDYVIRRTAHGLSKPDIIRCLKRYLARELFPLLRSSQARTTVSPDASAA